MAPKKKAGGKKKGADDDDHWDKLAASKSPAASSPAPISDDEDVPQPVKKGGKKAGGFSFADLGDEYENEEDPDEGGDSLMAILKAAKDKPKDKKKKKKNAAASDDEDAAPVESVDLDSKKAVEVSADDWMNDEFGDSGKKKKEKKGKKGGKPAPVVEEADDEEPEVKEVTKAVEKVAISEPAPAAADAAADAEGDSDAEEDGAGGVKILSKKEKERLKKEKEKAKKKAQAAAKKAASGGAAAAPAPSEPSAAAAAEPAPTPAAAAATEAAADDDDAEEGGAATKSSKNKKKKKKAAEPVPPPAAAPKKGGGQLSALRALVEAQKKAAEEAAERERLERERIEAEERAAEEAEKLLAEEKARRKEKEKAKKEQLKKDGKLLTPKQKAEKAAAEARLKALMQSSGVTVAGLAGGDGAPAKRSYGRQRQGKKAPGAPKAAEEPAAEPEKKPEPEVVAAQPEPVPEPAKEDDDDVKDSWDASSSEDEKDDVKDDWDAESEPEEEAKPAAPVAKAPAPAAAAAPKTNGAAAKKVEATPAKKPEPTAASAKGKKPAVGEEEEDEEDEDDDDDDEESDEDDSSDDDSEDDSDSDDESEDGDGMTATQRAAAQRKEEARLRRQARDAAALAARSKDDMRSPICVILGHVDTGKTSLLDKVRQTNVQGGEAGGITQQIGATYFPMESIRKKTSVLAEHDLKEYKLPGLLVIDTPGHESFTNLRSRGSSLCNIAILVVDIMHGLEPQTLESLRLLRDGKTPFIVALNKVDRMYGWTPIPNGGFQKSLASQSKATQREFADRMQKTILAFAEQGLNAAPYYENKDLGRTVSLVPTSAHTGEGIPDMLMLIIKLTQERMSERLMYLSTLECTVLEVKVIEGLGTTIDVVLSNGVLHEGDKFVVCGLNGPIVTHVRGLLTPEPLKELRVKGAYVHHKMVKASLGIKITAPDLEKTIAGSRLLVCGPDDDEDDLKEDVMGDLASIMDRIDKSGKGVCVQASTLGSLEALLEFLSVSKIPVSGINIGPVHRKDVMRCASMLEKNKELAVILCFDVAVDKEADRVAEELGIKIFKADIIYHLFDQFTAYNKSIVEAKRADSAPKAVWPCKLKIIAVFAKRDPIIVGCDIIDGNLRVGTPLCVVKTDPETGARTTISLGKVTSLEINHKNQEIVKKTQAGAGVAVKIEAASYEPSRSYGRHFDEKDELISMVSRQSIDVLKEVYREEVSKEEWILIKQLKTRLNIP